MSSTRPRHPGLHRSRGALIWAGIGNPRRSRRPGETRRPIPVGAIVMLDLDFVRSRAMIATDPARGADDRVGRRAHGVGD